MALNCWGSILHYASYATLGAFLTAKVIALMDSPFSNSLGRQAVSPVDGMPVLLHSEQMPVLLHSEQVVVLRRQAGLSVGGLERGFALMRNLPLFVCHGCMSLKRGEINLLNKPQKQPELW